MDTGVPTSGSQAGRSGGDDNCCGIRKVGDRPGKSELESRDCQRQGLLDINVRFASDEVDPAGASGSVFGLKEGIVHAARKFVGRSSKKSILIANGRLAHSHTCLTSRRLEHMLHENSLKEGTNVSAHPLVSA